MSDVKDEDLLLGDDIDDQALFGADEDELLLTDEELEKDVTNEEKQQIKAEAEQWVREQIQEQHKRPQRASGDASETSVNTTEIAPVATTEVSSTANYDKRSQVAVPPLISGTAQGDDVSTSEAATEQVGNNFSATREKQNSCKSFGSQNNKNSNRTPNAEDTISSSSKEIDGDHISLISCSTAENVTDSSLIPSSQESVTGVSVGGISREFADPRDDCDDEREERTNIKTTNEREVESTSSSDQSPDVHPRYGQNKRLPVDGQHPIIRPHRYSSRPPFPPRAMMNRGPYPPMAHAGHFPPQHVAVNTSPHNMYGPMSTQQSTHGGLPPSPTNPMNSVSSPHEMIPRMAMRHPFPGFRPGTPMSGMGGNFRHPIHGNAYGPQDYNGSGQPHGQPYGQNFMPHPPGVRNMFRPEMQQGIPPRMPPPLGIRMPRAPLPQHNMSGSGGFSNLPSSGIRPQLPPQQPSQSGLQNVSTNAPTAANLPHAVASSGSSSTTGPALRPNKVLINPNFKGGVEAATSKFIQETQYMAVIGGVPRSDDELLRQQEEFINKNRQHIEKRRHERAASPTPVRRSSRSRSRSRTPRSRSRERSYTPPNKRSGALVGGERHFERERDRDRERERERERDRGAGLTRAGSRDRDRERERERDRERGVQSYGSRGGGNRFRRGNSRDRGGPGDYDSRGGSGGNLGNYNKRRRSISPSVNRGNMMGGRRGRSGDRDRNEEDDETRAYRLQIEKQKELREKVMRDKEMKRRRAAEEKQHEEKRGPPQTSGNSNNQSSSQTNKSNNNNGSSSHDEPQKYKPIIVTQPKIISLKKRQQSGDSSNDRQRQRSVSPSSGPPPRKQLPTAKILPEAKRTLTEHLTSAGSGGSGGGSGGGGHSSNTAIIKPVQKSRELSHHRQTPPLPGTKTTSSSLPSKHTRRLSTPSDDEVQLDYDEDELMLDEEDRLLATPTPSPSHRTAALSRTPSPEQLPPIQSSRNKTQKNNSTSSGVTFSSNNRRVVLKQHNERSGTESTSGRSRRGNSRQRDTGSSSGNLSQSSRKGIFDRLDVRSGGSGSHSSGAGSEAKRKAHRIVLKHE